MSKCPSLHLTDRDRRVLGLEPWDCDLDAGHDGEHVSRVDYVVRGERIPNVVVAQWADSESLPAT